MAATAGVAFSMPARAAPPTFPSTLDREPLLSWLTRETDIVPDRVVAVTPQALTAVVSSFPQLGEQSPRVVLRAEALTGETHARTGALSWHVSMSADCATHRVRLGETTGYAERNLLGERRVLRAAETEWRSPEPGTALDNAWRVACDPEFLGPFQDPATRVARAEAAPSTPASAASAPAPAAAPPAPRKPSPVRPAVSRPAPQVATQAATPAPGRAGGFSVQIGSYPDKAAATAAVGALGDPRGAVQAAVVAGRTWYRAVVTGFATPAEAAAYCAQRKAGGGACLIRGGSRG